MGESAETERTAWSARRYATGIAISQAAQELTLIHGLDGFSVDDLAQRAGIARRTLFTYYPSKLDAVLGPFAHFPEEDLATFRAGGPHGSLVDDLGALALTAFLAYRPTAEDAARHRRLLREPRLLRAAHDRFERLTDEIADQIRLREGAAHDPSRARLAIAILVGIYETALADVVADRAGAADLPDHLASLLLRAHDLFTPASPARTPHLVPSPSPEAN